MGIFQRQYQAYQHASGGAPHTHTHTMHPGVHINTPFTL